MQTGTMFWDSRRLASAVHGAAQIPQGSYAIPGDMPLYGEFNNDGKFANPVPRRMVPGGMLPAIPYKTNTQREAEKKRAPIAQVAPSK